MVFGSDAFLWYNVGDFGQLGLAVPNFGNDTKSQNSTIRNLAEVIGRNLQAIMFHSDARLRTPPSINTLRRIHALCTRIRSLLASRAVPANRNNMESAHALPASEEFLVFPAPYFKVRNSWLKEWCGYALLALTEAFQHQENGRPIEISEAFSGLVGQYFQRIYQTMSVDLFRVPLVEAQALDFTLSPERLNSYNPSAWFTQTELIDTVPQDVWVPTEDDLEVLTNGIPISQLPAMTRWPAGAGTSGNSTTSTAAAAAKESFAPAPTP